MRVRILAWSVATLVSLSKSLYHNCFSPPRSTNGYRQELGRINLRWTGILSRGNINILSRSMPIKPDINTGLMRHIGLRQTLVLLLQWFIPPIKIVIFDLITITMLLTITDMLYLLKTKHHHRH